MNTLNIPGASIQKIQHKEPFIESQFNRCVSYEWFYFEIQQAQNSIVFIIGVKDSFCINKNADSPVSIYLTWHINNKICAYSYSIYSEQDGKIILNKLLDFIYKKTDTLDLLIPDFSYKKFIHFKISNTFLSQHSSHALSVEKNSNHHYWQLLYSGLNFTGSIEIIEIISDIAKNFLHQRNLFYDVYLKHSLTRTSPKRLEFTKAHLYVDHNFGFNPLYNIADPWYWWHLEAKDEWEVCYYFPKQKKAFYESSHQKNTIINCQLPSIFYSFKIQDFFLYYPKKLKSPLFNDVTVAKKIEAAPFYIRVQTEQRNPQITGTLEVLIPKRIAKWINQTLMSARHLHNKAIPSNLTALEQEISFKKLCQKITRYNGKSFYFASKILDSYAQQNSYFIYSLCRIIDDATDSLSEKSPQYHNFHFAGAGFSHTLVSLLWNKSTIQPPALFNTLKKRISYCAFLQLTEASISNFILQSQNLIQKHHIDKNLFDDLILGQKMDESFQQPENFQSFYKYCYYVAGAVGLLMTKIFKVHHSSQASLAAEHLGIAMQITNILRDIKEDYAMNRIYLPKDICTFYDLKFSEDFFQSPEKQKANKILMVNAVIQTALYYYESSIVGIKYIRHFRNRFCVKLMAAMYSGILAKIEKNPLIVFEKRTIVSKWEKIIIFFKVALGRHPLTAAKFDRSQFKVTREFTHEKL